MNFSLPTALMARILTYNVATLNDIAKLRLVGKAVGRQAIHLLPLETSQWFICPGRGPFVERLLTMDWDVYKKFSAVPGESFEVASADAFLIQSDDGIPSDIVTVHVAGQPKYLYEATDQEGTAKTADFESNETTYLRALEEVCDSIMNATSADQLIAEDSDVMAFFRAPPGSNTRVADAIQAQQGNVGKYDGYFSIAVPAMVTFSVDPAEPYVKRELQVGNTKFYQIEIIQSVGDEPFYDDIKAQRWALLPLFEGGQVWAVAAGPDDNGKLQLVRMLLYLMIDEFDLCNDGVYNMKSHRLLRLGTFWNEHQKHQLVEGVAIVDNFISPECQQSLQEQVDALAEKQQREHAVDYHPHSNHVVRDLIHPALYSYIQDVTTLISNVNDTKPFHFPKDPLVVHEPGKDFWGRPYETSVYQWLPSYVSISADGKCSFDTYINNLTPREDPIHSALYNSLEALLGHALPYMESVLSYVQAVRRVFPSQDRNQGGFLHDPLTPLEMKRTNLRGQKLQVIPKIVDYELTPQQDSYEGVWHVEGMSHEEIVLTCLFILDRDKSIEGGEIEFKRTFLTDEVDLIRGKISQSRPDHFSNMIEEGLLPLGTVATPAGRLVVFPNSHVHRVKAMKLIRPRHSDETCYENRERRQAIIAKRRIVVFFVINPQKRIISTREVAPQQIHSGGTLSHEEALEHRLKLMAERKFKKQDWNVRTIELCEH